MTPVPVHVAVFDTLADWEIGYLTAHLGIAQRRSDPCRYQVVTVGLTSEPVTTLGGFRVIPDVALAEIEVRHSAMLVLPGGDAWPVADSPLRPFAQTAGDWLRAGVPVAAICGATHALAREGLLDGVGHASNSAQFLAATGYAGGDRYVDEPAWTEGNVITAAGRAPVHFAREVFRRLDVMPPAVLDAWFRTYAEQDGHAFDRPTG